MFAGGGSFCAQCLCTQQVPDLAPAPLSADVLTSVSSHQLCLPPWKGLVRVRGQSTAFQQVLKFRAGV